MDWQLASEAVAQYPYQLPINARRLRSTGAAPLGVRPVQARADLEAPRRANMEKPCLARRLSIGKSFSAGLNLPFFNTTL